MQNFIPTGESFSAIDLEGTGALDFAQRMFTRDFRGLKSGDGRLSLFLSADGKVQHLFWAFIEPTGLKLFVESKAQKSLFDLIEKYHFADPFKTILGAAVPTQWEPAEAALQNGSRRGEIYEGFWRGTKLTFSPSLSAAIANSANESEWVEHRRTYKLLTQIEYQGQLVFKIGFDSLCDAGKGCYIGQEVVERVRTRDLRKSS